MTGMAGYLLADRNAVALQKSVMVLYHADGRLRRFDYDSGEWVSDGSLVGVFDGSIATMPLTEKVAREVVERHGGTWKPME